MKSTHQKEIRDAEVTRKEIESKLVEELSKHSQLSEQFRVFKEQYLKLEKDNTDSAEALNGRTQQLDAKQHELEELQSELVVVRTQVSPV